MTTAWQKRNCRCEIYFSKNVCPMRGKNASYKICLLGNIPPRMNASSIICDQEKYLLRKKSSFKYHNTTGSHYNFRGIFIFPLESYSHQY